MPCDKCEIKYKMKASTPDVGKGAEREKATNRIVRQKTELNKLLGKFSCKDCKKALHSKGKYCARCASVKGRCWICGKKCVNVENHRTSDSWR